MDWNAISTERLADGSFIVLAEIAVAQPEQPQNILGPEVVLHALPTMIKLDSNLKVVWAKSLEMIPTELNTPASYSSTSLTMGKTVIRLAGGDFRVSASGARWWFYRFWL